MFDPELFEAPLTPVSVTVHEKVVPATPLVKAMDVVLPEQNVWEDGVAVAVGIGLTVTVAIIGTPAQPVAVGVMV